MFLSHLCDHPRKVFLTDGQLSTPHGDCGDQSLPPGEPNVRSPVMLPGGRRNSTEKPSLEVDHFVSVRVALQRT